MNRNIASEKFSEIKNADKVLEVLLEIMTAVQSTQNLFELYQAIHKSLVKVLNVDNFFIANHNPEKDSISFPYFVDEQDVDVAPEIFNFSKTGSLTGKVIQSGKPQIFFSDDLSKFKQENRLAGLEPIGSASKIWLGVPLIVNKRIIGVIAVQSYISEDIYDESDLDILDMVSRHIAFALERKEADDAIRKQREMLEKILELSPVGIALLENRAFKMVNNEFIKLFGYADKSDFEDNTTQMLYASKEDYDKAGKIIKPDSGIKRRSDFKYTLVKKDKTPFSARIIINHSIPSASMAWEVASITDISRIENREKERLKHEKLQGVLEMAGAICHELNQPLHAILGYCDLLMMDENIDKKELQSILKVIIEQIKRIEEITKKLLGITEYKTLKYAGKNRIFDIWNAGADNE